MKKYKVSKQQIINAVMTEPLTSGSWFKDVEQPTTCEVCAVGAVMRKVKLDKEYTGHVLSDAGFKITNDIYSDEDISEAYRGNNFLSILSTEHEAFANQQIYGIYDEEIGDYVGGGKGFNLELQRTHLLSVIEAFCPPVVEFEV